MKQIVYYILFIIIGFNLLFTSHARNFPASETELYFVYFTDKKNVDFDPYDYFHPYAIERRIKNGICLYDESDFPVKESYIKKVASTVDSASYASRWFNGLFVFASQEQVEHVQHFTFVREVEKISKKLAIPASFQRANDLSTFSSSDRRLLKLQTRHLNGHEFYNRRIDGTGVRIAIFDAGFPGVNTHDAFKHIIDERRVAGTWDFHKDIANVFKDNVHGTNVLSAVAGFVDTIPMGLATGADFLLARTEIIFEFFFEEKYWLAAAEWADKNGAHIINSSVGYTYHRYFPEQMDGNTSLVARAATMASRKGIVVVISAGNEGSKDNWETLCTPGDADSVLTVGAIDPDTFLVTEYSSKGPTADKRMKPNVSAFGTVISASASGYSTPSGTSFSSPLVVGFAACVMQMYPDWNNMQVIEEIQKSASLYPYYDYSHGYGVPDANYFLEQQFKPTEPTFEFVLNDDELEIRILNNKSTAFEIDLPKDILYLNISDDNGVIQHYYVVQVYQEHAFSLDLKNLLYDQKVVAHYRGFTSVFNPGLEY